jgi:putative ABC transport system permease protein
VGKSISWSRVVGEDRVAFSPSTIVGVVPDFSLKSAREVIDPQIYYVDRQSFYVLNVKLDGGRIPETLGAIDAVWNRVGEPGAINRHFLDELLQGQYRDVVRQGQAFAIFSVIALLVACMGLLGLAVATAERRTKEIGIRKAIGARSADILRLLSWEFAKPVLLANLIAWPVAYWALQSWLDGFAYHIELELWMFVAAGALALVIALATVSVHSPNQSPLSDTSEATRCSATSSPRLCATLRAVSCTRRSTWSGSHWVLPRPY